MELAEEPAKLSCCLIQRRIHAIVHIGLGSLDVPNRCGAEGVEHLVHGMDAEPPGVGAQRAAGAVGRRAEHFEFGTDVRWLLAVELWDEMRLEWTGQGSGTS